MKNILSFIGCVLFIVLFIFGFFRLCGLLINQDDIKEQGKHTISYTVYYPNSPKIYEYQGVYQYSKTSGRGSTHLSVWIDRRKPNPLLVRIFLGDPNLERVTIYEDTAPVSIDKYYAE